MKTPFLISIGFLVAARTLLASDPVADRANSIERVLRFEQRVVNAAANAQDIEIRLPLPRTNERQEVLFLYPEPGFEEILEDRLGNRVARYVERAVEPGGVRTRGWMASVRAYAAVYRAQSPATLSAEERALYTQDASNYKISAPEVLAVRDACVREGMTDEEKAIAVFRWLVANVTYVRDGRWDPAPQVISRRQGSCSEYNYALVAILRSLGIPCRWTGGVVLSLDNRTAYDPGVHEDRIFHRWTEIWLEGKGWVSADASRGSGAGRRFDNFMNYWGRLPAGLVQTFRSDGNDGGLIGWEYVAEARAAAPIKALPVCYWIEAPPNGLEPSIRAVSEALRGELPAARLAEIARDRLSREVLLFFAGRLEAASYPRLSRALFEARHPEALRFSVLCALAGLEVPAELRPEALAGARLAGAIRGFLSGSRTGRAGFEEFWRKSRPAIRFDATSGRFELPAAQSDL